MSTLSNTFSKLVFLALSFLLTACISDLDFEQAETIIIRPVLTSSVVYGSADASNFVENGVEIDMVIDSIANIEIFEEPFVNDNLIRTELVFEVNNTINRNFELKIDFLNSDFEIQHSITFEALSAVNNQNITTEYIEIFEDESIDALKQSSVIIFTFSLLPSADASTLNENSLGTINLKSLGNFYFEITN